MTESSSTEQHLNETEREAMKKLVLDSMAAHCSESSDSPVLKTFDQALKQGSNLSVKMLSGGYTNVSYKVFLPESPSTAVFAKLSLPYALWNPDGEYDVQRTENEFLTMKRVASLLQGEAPVATPYFCEDVGDGCKLLVAEWAPADELLSKQFLHGVADHRILPKLTEALVRLHCVPVTEPDFNKNIKAGLVQIMPRGCEYLSSALLYATDKPSDRVADLAKEYGKDVCESIMEACIQENNFCTDTYTHGDVNSSNILVEKLRSDGSFGEKALVYICDWESSRPGPIGFDVGSPIAFPIGCAIWHANQGRGVAVDNMLAFVDAFWDAYAEAAVRIGKKDQKFLKKAYRSGVAWSGWFLFLVMFIMRAFVENFTYRDMAETEHAKVMESIGVVGLQLMRWGFGNSEIEDLSLEELRTRVRETIVTECERHLMASACKQVHPTRPRHSKSLQKRPFQRASV